MSFLPGVPTNSLSRCERGWSDRARDQDATLRRLALHAPDGGHERIHARAVQPPAARLAGVQRGHVPVVEDRGGLALGGRVVAEGPLQGAEQVEHGGGLAGLLGAGRVHVLHVHLGRGHVAGQVLPRRHGPGQDPGPADGLEHLQHQRVGRVAGEQVDHGPERHPGRARERGRGHDHVRVVGLHQRVDPVVQGQATLGVGVVIIHQPAAARGQDAPRQDAREVVGAVAHQDQVQRQAHPDQVLEQGDLVHEPELVQVHVRHVRDRRLHGPRAGVVVDLLAQQGQRARPRIPAGVARQHTERLTAVTHELARPLVDREERTPAPRRGAVQPGPPFVDGPVQQAAAVGEGHAGQAAQTVQGQLAHLARGALVTPKVAGVPHPLTQATEQLRAFHGLTHARLLLHQQQGVRHLALGLLAVLRARDVVVAQQEALQHQAHVVGHGAGVAHPGHHERALVRDRLPRAQVATRLATRLPQQVRVFHQLGARAHVHAQNEAVPAARDGEAVHLALVAAHQALRHQTGQGLPLRALPERVERAGRTLAVRLHEHHGHLRAFSTPPHKQIAFHEHTSGQSYLTGTPKDWGSARTLAQCTGQSQKKRVDRISA